MNEMTCDVTEGIEATLFLLFSSDSIMIKFLVVSFPRPPPAHSPPFFFFFLFSFVLVCWVRDRKRERRKEGSGEEEILDIKISIIASVPS